MRFLHKVAMSFAALAVMPSVAVAQEARPFATIFKNPQCSCCESYGDYLEASGYEVKMVATHDLALIKERQGVPAGLEGCHTMLIGGYFVDGHVPVDSVNRLLQERPRISGITLPGMPAGSPGMGGAKTGTWTITGVAADGATSVYARY